MDETNDFEALVAEVMADRNARVAYIENSIRREIAERFESALAARGMGVQDFTARLGTGLAQARRVLAREVGGDLTLNTICRAADLLGFDVEVRLTPKA